MSDSAANNPVPNRDAFVNIAEQFHNVKTSDEQARIIKEHLPVIALANKADRMLGRAGLPLSVRIDERTDEIPIVAGGKRVVLYGGATAGLVWAGKTLWAMARS